MGDADLHYDSGTIAFLEAIWGEGYLSPGGPAEVARVLDGIDLKGKRVLDIGCGAGGITASLVAEYGAAHVTGLDVEPDVCNATRAFMARKGLTDRVDVVQVMPGPLPFAPGQFRYRVFQGQHRPYPRQGGISGRCVRGAAPGRMVRRVGLADLSRRGAVGRDGALPAV